MLYLFVYFCCFDALIYSYFVFFNLTFFQRSFFFLLHHLFLFSFTFNPISSPFLRTSLYYPFHWLILLALLYLLDKIEYRLKYDILKKKVILLYVTWNFIIHNSNSFNNPPYGIEFGLLNIIPRYSIGIPAWTVSISSQSLFSSLSTAPNYTKEFDD